MSNWKKRREAARQKAYKSAEASFVEYWEYIFPDPQHRPNDESAQFIECRRAFFAGILHVICTIRNSRSNEEAADKAEALTRECRAFYEKMARIYGLDPDSIDFIT